MGPVDSQKNELTARQRAALRSNSRINGEFNGKVGLDRRQSRSPPPVVNAGEHALALSRLQQWQDAHDALLEQLNSVKQELAAAKRAQASTPTEDQLRAAIAEYEKREDTLADAYAQERLRREEAEAELETLRRDSAKDKAALAAARAEADAMGAEHAAEQAKLAAHVAVLQKSNRKKQRAVDRLSSRATRERAQQQDAGLGRGQPAWSTSTSSVTAPMPSVEAGAGGPAILIAKLEQLEAALSDARARERKLEAENRALIDSTR